MLMVYVDHMRTPFRRMVMCHLFADTTEELLAIVDQIGVQQKWIQKAGTPHEHFDICLSKRALAVAAGAKEVGHQEAAALFQRKRQAAAGRDLTARPQHGLPNDPIQQQVQNEEPDPLRNSEPNPDLHTGLSFSRSLTARREIKAVRCGRNNLNIADPVNSINERRTC